MKAKWVNIVDSLQGNVDQRHYARRIPGNGEWGCRVREAGVEQEDKESKGGTPDGKSLCGTDGGDKGNHA